MMEPTTTWQVAVTGLAADTTGGHPVMKWHPTAMVVQLLLLTVAETVGTAMSHLPIQEAQGSILSHKVEEVGRNRATMALASNYNKLTEYLMNKNL
jgi:hypothetical protein